MIPRDTHPVALGVGGNVARIGSSSSTPPGGPLAEIVLRGRPT